MYLKINARAAQQANLQLTEDANAHQEQDLSTTNAKLYAQLDNSLLTEDANAQLEQDLSMVHANLNAELTKYLSTEDVNVDKVTSQLVEYVKPEDPVYATKNSMKLLTDA